MITAKTNSQPPEGTDELHEASGALCEIVKNRGPISPLPTPELGTIW